MSCPTIRIRLILLISTVLLGAGCMADRKTADSPGGAPPRAAATTTAGDVRAACTVAPECPPSGNKGELTTVRSGHTWTVENTSDQPRDFIVVLEISDNLGHVKRKEVPGQVKPHAKVEDSTSIALVTTYQDTGAIDAQARTTVRMGNENLATNAQTCGFQVR